MTVMQEEVTEQLDDCQEEVTEQLADCQEEVVEQTEAKEDEWSPTHLDMTKMTMMPGYHPIWISFAAVINGDLQDSLKWI